MIDKIIHEPKETIRSLRKVNKKFDTLKMAPIFKDVNEEEDACLGSNKHSSQDLSTLKKLYSSTQCGFWNKANVSVRGTFYQTMGVDRIDEGNRGMFGLRKS